MKYVGLFFLLFLSLGFKSQTLKEFGYFSDKYGNENKYIGFSISETRLSNKSAPYPEEHSIKGISGEFEYSKVNFEKFKTNFRYQNKLIIDVIMSLRQMLYDTGTAIKAQESRLSNGAIGWLNYSWIINTPKRYSVALGFNLNDYILTSSYKIDSATNYSTGQLKTIEPQGYWWAAGPTINTNLLINKYLMVASSISYSISYLRVVSVKDAVVNNNYPKPHFGQFSLELISNVGFFTGIDYNWLVNRGNQPNDTKRLDLMIGFRFML